MTHVDLCLTVGGVKRKRVRDSIELDADTFSSYADRAESHFSDACDNIRWGLDKLEELASYDKTGRASYIVEEAGVQKALDKIEKVWKILRYEGLEFNGSAEAPTTYNLKDGTEVDIPNEIYDALTAAAEPNARFDSGSFDITVGELECSGEIWTMYGEIDNYETEVEWEISSEEEDEDGNYLLDEKGTGLMSLLELLKAHGYNF